MILLLIWVNKLNYYIIVITLKPLYCIPCEDATWTLNSQPNDN